MYRQKLSKTTRNPSKPERFLTTFWFFETVIQKGFDCFWYNLTLVYHNFCAGNMSNVHLDLFPVFFSFRRKMFKRRINRHSRGSFGFPKVCECHENFSLQIKQHHDYNTYAVTPQIRCRNLECINSYASCLLSSWKFFFAILTPQWNLFR